MSEARRSGAPRPQSTIAQIFADDLDAMFGLTPEVEQLSQTVENKKLQVFSNERELQELEARLRKAEQRLARVSRHNSPSPSRAPAEGSEPAATATETSTAPRGHPLAQRPTYPADRPPTSDQRNRSGTATPNGMATGGVSGYQGPGGNDFVMVDRNAAQAQRGYG